MAEADHVTCRGALAQAAHEVALRALPSWPLTVTVCQRIYGFGVYCWCLRGNPQPS